MKLIALETSTEACSVAVAADDLLIERFEIAPRRHAELALPWADALLAEAGIARRELAAVAVGRGPGAFTGVRLGVSLAQGIALALDIPAIGVSTLAALAMRAPMVEGQRILAAIDARMGEVYWAAFEVHGGLPQLLGDEHVGAPASVAIAGAGWHGVGTGFSAQEGELGWLLEPRMVHVDAEALPHAADVARLAKDAHARGLAVAPERLEPAYLRNQVALTLAEQQALREVRR